MRTVASWMAAGLTKLTTAGRSASPEPKTDHVDWVHLRPETRAARLRLAKQFYWCASDEDKDLTDDQAVMAAINRYLAFRQRPLLDPAE